ncbi:MAG: HAMP domain-containing sensor histidine kinase [Ferruginibacter sp.]
MPIKPNTLKWMIITGSIIAALIISVQLFWLQKIYNYEQKLFNTNVTKSIRALYGTIRLQRDSAFNVTQAIENPRSDLYIIKIEAIPEFTKVSEILAIEFSDFDIFTDCKLGFYDRTLARFVREDYIDIPDANYTSKNNIEIPAFRASYNYIALFFPNRKAYVLKQMYFWILSGGVLIFALIGSAISIFFLYKQRFLNEIQKEFVNNFTHEFKTPLAVLKIAASVIQQPDIIEKPKKLQKYTIIINDQIQHLQDQTQRLLQIAYTEQAALPLIKKLCNVGDIMKKSLDGLAPLIEEKKAVIHLENKLSLPYIQADSAYLLLSFVNILENALKYSRNPNIIIKLENSEKHVCIGIKDNGPGIEKKHQQKIFNKFYRISSGDVQPAKGFGLGLNFVKKIMMAHKATIKVISEPGAGTQFLFKIPIR